MTDDTVKTEARPARSASAVASLITDLGLTAGFAWIGGIALNRGFGVSVPFGAAWLLLLGGMWLAQLTTGQLSRIWHRERVKADIDLLAASMAAQDVIHKRETDGLDDFLAKLSKPDSKDTGAYL